MKIIFKHSKTFIIAEAGVNHNGSLAMAKRLIKAAKHAGADAIKFQSFQAGALVTQDAKKAGYQKRSARDQQSQYKMLKRLELNRQAHVELMQECKSQRILFLSSPFDEPSADLLAELKVKIFKIPSGEITNLPFLKYLARKMRPMILSTGMSNLEEVRTAVDAIYRVGNKKLNLMHCITDYPAAFEELNLRAIVTLQKEFGIPVGFSDHSLGIMMAPIAVTLGARLIEKHFTLGRHLTGPDHKASLEPKDFGKMVSQIRLVEKALGHGQKIPAKCERAYIPLVRKSIVASREIQKGQLICTKDLAIKRPGSGIAPLEMAKVVGRKAKKMIHQDEILTWSMIA